MKYDQKAVGKSKQGFVLFFFFFNILHAVFAKITTASSSI